MNGVPFSQKHLNSEDFEEQLLTTIMAETQVLPRAVYKNQLTDSMDLLDYLMSRENIMPRLNQRILGSHAAPMVQLAGSQEAALDLASFSVLDRRSQAATLARHLPYLRGSRASSLRMVTLWVVADLETPEGRAVARAAVTHVKASGQVT
jgi:UDP-glucose:glycoprotein glucosyltransferase